MKTKIFFLSLALFLFFSFPAKADTVTINATADAFVDTSQPSRNFGQDADLDVTSTPASDAVISYVSFNINSFIPLGSTLQSATLKLYQRNRTCDSMPTRIYRATSRWSEGSVTYNLHPNHTIDGASWVNFPYFANFSGYAGSDVTDIVKGWVENRYLNYGFVIYNRTYNDCFAYFSSRQGNHPPTLELKYTSPPPAPDRTAPLIGDIHAQVDGTSATITWRTNELTYGSVIYKKVSYNIWPSVGDRRDTLLDHSVTLDNLAPGTRYQYRIKAKDVAGNDNISDIKTFTTASSAPSGSDPDNSDSSGSGSGASGSGAGSGGSGSNSGGQQNGDPRMVIDSVSEETWSPGVYRITWHTSLPGYSWVVASASADDSTPVRDYEIVRGRSDDVNDHEIFLDGLEVSTQYSFRVFSMSSDGRGAVSDRYVFTTDGRTQESGQSEPDDGSNNADEGENDEDDGYQPMENVQNVPDQPTAEQIKQQAAGALGQSGTDDDAKQIEELKKELAQEAGPGGSGGIFSGALDFALFIFVRSIFPLLIFLLIISLIIILIVKRKRKKVAEKEVIIAAAEAGEGGNKKSESKAAQKNQPDPVAVAAAPAPRKSRFLTCLVIFIVMAIFFLVLLKNILPFFIPIPFL